MKTKRFRISPKCISIFILSALIVSCSTTNVKKSSDLKTDPSIKSGALKNGISYFVQSNSKPKNRIELRLVVKTGSANEEDDQQGVAHFIEHLAFNGTEHFEKNSLIKYFESIGMDFGSDMNAYTGFNETVFNLTVPADNPEFLDNALLIFRDWASAISFDPEEIEKERGVILEERRLRQGLSDRYNKVKNPFLYKDSVYAQRLPIGQADVIKNITYERIVDYYKKWYRPELMSIAVVGDADSDYLIKKIKDIFNSIPESKEKINPVVHEIPEVQGKQSLYFTDKEEPNVEILIAGQNVSYPSLTEEDFKHDVAFNMLSDIISFRFSKIIMDPSSPWLSSYATDISNNDAILNNGFYLLPKEGREQEALMLLMDECDRFVKYGVTDSEVKDAATRRIQRAKNYLENEENHNSSGLVDNLVESILSGSVDYSAQEYYLLAQKIVKTIDKNYIHEIINEYFSDRGNFLIVLCPEDKQNISEKEAFEIWTEYKNENIEPYENEDFSLMLMERPSDSCSVVSKKYDSATDCTEYVLSNGIHFIYKKTDFEKNYFNFHAISKGGSNLISDSDYPSYPLSVQYSIFSGVGNLDYNGFQKYYADKDYRLSLSIGNIYEYLNGSCHNDEVNMESFFQLLYLYLQDPKFDENIWDFLDQSVKSQAMAFGSDPIEIYRQKINETIYGDIRHASLDMDFYSKMNKDVSEKIYKERFCNPGDFIYIFTGDVEENALLNFCKIYLGAFDTSKTVYENYKEIIYSFKEGITENTVAKGNNDKGRVNIAFASDTKGFDAEKVFEQDLISDALNSVLDTRLREVLREDAGGTYGVGVSCYFTGLRDQQFKLTVDFGCEIEREKELKELVLKELDLIIKNGIDQSYVDAFKENWRRNRENSLRKNTYWIGVLSTEYLYGIESPDSYLEENLDTLITAEILQKCAADYIHIDNYIATYLVNE